MEVNFNDPTEHIPVVKFPGYYTVIVRESFDTFTLHFCLTRKEVHNIIRKEEDYKFHSQKISDPYTYTVITKKFYDETHGESLFNYAF